MSAGSRAFRIEETLIGPGVLDPPPTRHALFVFVIAFAALLHLTTIGSGDIQNRSEGMYGGGAREMLADRNFLLPTNDGQPQLQTPPLCQWLVIGSYRVFGVSEAAARLPFALAIVITSALVFLIAERLGNHWQGFLAALIYTTSAGSFLLARMVLPDGIFTASVTAAIYIALRGYQDRNSRARCAFAFWISIALATMAQHPLALLYPAAVLISASFLFREARLRFRAFLDLRAILIFAALVLPWHLWLALHLPEHLHELLWLSAPQIPRLHLVGLHVGGLFPWLLLAVPALLFAARRVIRITEFDFAEALPLIWIAVGILMLLASPIRGGAAMAAWPAIAILVARTWERSSAPIRIAGIFLVIAAGILLALYAGGALPFGWPVLKPGLTASSAALILFGVVAIILTRFHRSELAAISIAAAMVPVGLAIVDGTSQMSPYFSLANAARFTNPGTANGAELIFEGSLEAGSSLLFYFPRKFFLVHPPPQRMRATNDIYLDESAVMAKWRSAKSVYMIVEQNRVAYWQRILTDEFHIYHQVTTCGTYAVLSNQL